MSMSMTPTPIPSASSSTGSTAVATNEKVSDFTISLPDNFPNPKPLSILSPHPKLIPLKGLNKFLLRLKLLFGLRGRLQSNTILSVNLSGSLPESSPSQRFSLSPSPLRLPTLLTAIRAAAHDPRISHLHLRIEPLSCGWAKILELRRYLDLFASSGKPITAFMETGGPKEFFLVAGFTTYVAPEGGLALRGFASSGSFVRGVLDKIGIDPQVERIGKYKSAGDQLSRTEMSDAQREVLGSVLDDVEGVWKNGICEATGIQREALDEFVNRAPWCMSEYVDAGLIAGVCYESQLIDALKLKYKKQSLWSEKDEDILRKPLRSIDVGKYARKRILKLLGLTGRKKIGIIRAVGAITGGKNGSSPVTGTTIGSDSLIEMIRKVKDDKRIEGVIVRCESPGGGALASDIVWHELRSLGTIKPVVASQGDVAASGGYYISVGACSIVSEALTITGSIGVVTAKPSLGKLYERIGYTKENVSVGGKYAQLLVDDRPFSNDELDYFKDGAKLAYDSFVKKVAYSRGKEIPDIEQVAQGRVWTGKQAMENGLVDYIGGIDKAIDVLKEKCGIDSEEFIQIEEITLPMSLAQRLGFGGASTQSNCQVETMVDSGKPMALAEIDADFGSANSISPVAKAVIDTVVAKASRVAAAAGGGRGQLWVGTIADKLISTLTAGN